ncbi:DUF481 domain-containing protein [Zophobihabitans entericus]|uniref:DUF481 domain-containing protein n=1 Tax=Zophobihabitans entericus TaxID=1635327 RepID=A0A6G9I8Q9_9GAMM|nr:DUF481 domain-containing protein [Zophobihabitans entericus]QIQ20603.1 DUF481 domain-containing protein [Zophobihabitans entericus]
MKLNKIVYLLLLAAGYAAADTVWVKNGDILSGKIQIVDNSKLVIDTKYAGEITLDIKHIKTFSIDAPSFVKLDFFADKRPAEKILPSENEGMVITSNGIENTPLQINDDLILFREKELPILKEVEFDGYIKGGFFYDKGTKTTEQYVLDVGLTGKYERWRHNFLGNYRQSIKDDNVSTHYYSVNYSLDKFINPYFFWQATAQYKHDWIEDIAAKRSIGTGPGYQLWDDELGAFSLALLINYQEMTYRNDESSTHPLGSVRWNYQRFLDGKSISFFTNGEIGRTFNDEVSLDFSATLGLTYKVTDWFSLHSTFTKDKDRTKEGNSSNTSYGLGFGVSW